MLYSCKKFPIFSISSYPCPTCDSKGGEYTVQLDTHFLDKVFVLYFNQLVNLLLQVDSSKRIKPHTALLLVQAILWGPVSWVHGTVSETGIQSYLAVEKARLVTSVALNSLKAGEKPSVELMLKNMFIQECKPNNLINALSLLNAE